MTWTPGEIAILEAAAHRIIVCREGPAYADRVGGKLTFRDWDRYTAEDQAKYADLRAQRLKAD